jgi:hypothetical protein
METGATFTLFPVFCLTTTTTSPIPHIQKQSLGRFLWPTVSRRHKCRSCRDGQQRVKQTPFPQTQEQYLVSETYKRNIRTVMEAAVSFGRIGKNETKRQNTIGITLRAMISFCFLYIIPCPLSIFFFVVYLTTLSVAVRSRWFRQQSPWHKINYSVPHISNVMRSRNIKNEVKWFEIYKRMNLTVLEQLCNAHITGISWSTVS